MLNNTVPVWLFSALYDYEVNGVKSQKWGEEKEKLAQAILLRVKQVAKNQYWDASTTERILYVNQHDEANMYGISPKSLNNPHHREKV